MVASKQPPMQLSFAKTAHWLGCAAAIAVLSLIAACAGPTPRERQGQQLIAKLSTSMKSEQTFIRSQTSAVCAALAERLTDYIHAEKAKIWQPVVDDIRTRAKSATGAMEGLLRMLKDEDAHTKAVKKLWSDSLFRVLARFKYAALHAHEYLMQTFENELIPGIPIAPQAADSGANAFAKANTDHFNHAETELLLQYWLKEVLLAENKLVTFCFNNSTRNFCGLNISSLLVGQSHSSLSPGETLTITAGVGSYSMRANPKITIQGQPAELDDGAHTTYRIKAPSKKGTYTVPVAISYINEAGVTVSAKKEVVYTVR
jgi:hypothetical protein